MPTRILLVEDNAADERLIREMLREAVRDGSEAFATDWVQDVPSALSRLRKGGCELVLLDLSLGESSGLDTFRAVHGAAGDVPVIILTGLDDEALAAQALREGAQDYLVKGHINAKWLERSVRAAIQRNWAATHSATIASRPAKTRLRSRFEVSQRLGSVVVRAAEKQIAGLDAVDDLRSTLSRMVDGPRPPNVLVNLSCVEYLSNAALNTLLVLDKKLKSAGRTLRLCSLRPEVMDAVAVRRLDGVLDIRREEDAALEGL